MEPTRSIRLVLAIAVALVPLAGALFMGWDVREVLLLFWVENLVIGGWQVVKMATHQPDADRGRGHAGKFFIIPFFLVHYGGFCAGHGLFLHHLTGHNMDFFTAGNNPALGPLNFVVLLWNVMSASIAVLPATAFLAVLAMVISHGLDTWRHYFANGDWRCSSRGHGLMFEPYKHIMVVHIAIMAGGFLVMVMKENGLVVLALIIIGKFILDWRTIQKREAEKEEEAVSS